MKIILNIIFRLVNSTFNLKMKNTFDLVTLFKKNYCDQKWCVNCVNLRFTLKDFY